MGKRSSTNARTEKPKNADEMTQREFERYRNTLYKFWRLCGQPRCERAKSCLGADTEKCFNRCWAMWPESEKWWSGPRSSRAQLASALRPR